jgi:3-oxoacyl-[acyl-carrier-protein] synthase-3
MVTQIGIAAAAVTLPAARHDTRSLFQEEAAAFNSEIRTRLGIDEVPICNGESASAMAMAACQEALGRAELDVAQLDVIVDYTILPQEYLVPAWNMSNKLQYELGAKKAFTVGFSGGGATNFLVALSSAAAMLQANANLTSALLVAADITILGNRILNPSDPVSVLGDSAGAMVLKKGVESSVVIDTELYSEGSYHDVCYIPGGALAHPDDPAIYRMELDKKRFDNAPKSKKLNNMLGSVLTRAGVSREDVVFALYPNLSCEDQQQFAERLGFSSDQINSDNRKSTGHLQGTDFVVNYLSMIESAQVDKGKYFVAASHGMGFLSGVSLLRR